MKIIILPLAEADLDDIYAFYAEKSMNAAVKIFNSILDEIEVLRRFPHIAPTEPWLKKQPKTFRSLLVAKGKFKVTYFIENEIIYITHVWSCKQNPEKLRKQQ